VTWCLSGKKNQIEWLQNNKYFFNSQSHKWTNIDSQVWMVDKNIENVIAFNINISYFYLRYYQKMGWLPYPFGFIFRIKSSKF